MTRTALRRTLLALLTLPALAMTAGPAAAAELSVIDTRHDLRSLEMNEDDQQIRWVKEPEVKHGDIGRVLYNHSERRVAMRTKYVDLERGKQVQFATRFRDENGKKAYIQVRANASNPAGRSTLRDYRTDEKIACAVNHKIDYAKNTLVVSFPRTCIGDPRRLEFTTITAVRYSGKLLFDNALTDRFGFGGMGWSNPVRKG
jgi:hypothetical protein